MLVRPDDHIAAIVPRRDANVVELYARAAHIRTRA
jgi:hypothetical protein